MIFRMKAGSTHFIWGVLHGQYICTGQGCRDENKYGGGADLEVQIYTINMGWAGVRT